MNRKFSSLSNAWLPAVILMMTLLACNVSQAVAPLTQASGQNDLPTASGGASDLPTAAGGQSEEVTTEPTAPASTETPTSTPIVHTLVPGELPASFLSEVTDRDSSATGAQMRVIGGENFTKNLYERPFNGNPMNTYFPDLDITRARLLRDSQWLYVEIRLVGQNPSGGLPGAYGVEVDLNVDGRGDVLVMAARPGANRMPTMM
jgi:hypothetical protein